MFYIQAWQGTRTITLIVEKIQVQSLAVGLEQFLAELQQRYPELPEAPGDYDEEHDAHPPAGRSIVPGGRAGAGL